jgi:hypothetical protein
MQMFQPPSIRDRTCHHQRVIRFGVFGDHFPICLTLSELLFPA